MGKKQKNRGPAGLLKRIFGLAGRLAGHRTDVYFISGMCYNCKVFDRLRLPDGFRKVYLEWYVPRPDETLAEYARTMAAAIDTSRPFALVGYSFGAVVMQEMLTFLEPRKSIIISSFKRREEIPALFKAVHKTKLVRRVPDMLFSSTDFITSAFNRFVYHMPSKRVARYMTCTDPVYVKWAVARITDWEPDDSRTHLFHIHGTDDQIFPFKHIRDVFPVEGGDHLMVVRKARKVSSILDAILLME